MNRSLERTGSITLKWLPFLLTVLLCLAGSLHVYAAHSDEPAAEKWDSARTISCPDNRPGCLLLQSVMMGSLDSFDPEDSLVCRVYSAMYPQMCSVSEEDLTHFCAEFDEEKQFVQASYYRALANCLHAMLLTQTAPDETTANAWRVLKLFLDPSCEPDGPAQLTQILEQLDAPVIQILADAAGTDTAFIEWLADQASSSSGSLSTAVPGSTNLPSFKSGILSPSALHTSTSPSCEYGIVISV